MRYFAMLSTALLAACAGDAHADDLVDPKAAEVVKAARAALGTPAAVRLEVRTVGGYELTKGVPKVPGRTTLLVTPGKPFRMDARLKGIDGAMHEVAVSSGEGTLVSSGGELRQLPKGAFYPHGAMGDAYVAAPWFVSPDRLAGLTAKGSLVYAGRTEVGGELCDLVVHIVNHSGASSQAITTENLWFSARTHLLRSIQVYGIYNGSPSLDDRRVFSRVELLAEVPPGAFETKPAAADTVALAKPKSESEESSTDRLRSIVGKPIPDVDLVDYPSTSTTLHKVLDLGSDQVGRPLTLLTFWATWCGPCVGEMPTFQKLAEERKGKLRVVAVAMWESKDAAMAYIKKHPEQAFRFSHGMEDDILTETFGIAGLPTNLLIDGRGKIVDAWLDSLPEDQTAARIDAAFKASE